MADFKNWKSLLPFVLIGLFTNNLYSKLDGYISLGYYGGFHFWEGTDVFQWDIKEDYPRVPKIHSSLFIKLGLKVNRYRLVFGIPCFYNYLYTYSYPDGLTHFGSQKSSGMGDIQIGLENLFKRLGFSIFIPGLYTSSKNSDLPESDSVLNYKLEPWRGLGMFRGEIRYFAYVNTMYLYGTANVSLWDYSGNSPARPGDSKLEMGLIKAISEKQLKLKFGGKMSHSRFHWYGAQNSPRVEMELVPLLITGIRIKNGMELNLSGSFTLKRWVFDPVNSGYAAKSLSFALTLSGLKLSR